MRFYNHIEAAGLLVGKRILILNSSSPGRMISIYTVIVSYFILFPILVKILGLPPIPCLVICLIPIIIWVKHLLTNKKSEEDMIADFLKLSKGFRITLISLYLILWVIPFIMVIVGLLYYMIVKI